MKKNLSEQAAYQLTGIGMARGMFTVLFGIIALVWPGLTLVSLAVITAIWLFLSGIMGAMTSLFMRDNYEHWFLRLILSVVQFGVGAYLVQRPDISISTFMLAIGLAFIIEGGIEMVLALSSDADGGSKALSLVVGMLSIIGGVAVWNYPVSGSLAFVWVLGLIALVMGTATIWLSVDARNKLSS